MNGNFRVENIVCKCVVSAIEKSKEGVYIGVAEGDCGSNATIATPCHSEIRDTKMTQSFQLFYGSLKNQQKKPLTLHGQF